MQFSLRKCEPTGESENECASEEEVKIYMKDVEIDSWALYTMMDMENLYHDVGKPIWRQQ